MQERPGNAVERLVTYDDFNATQIDPDKWFGWTCSTEPRCVSTEAIRQIQDKRLRRVYRVYGRTDSDSGRSRNELGLIFHNSAAVTAIKATVQVTDVAATSCPGNREATSAGAILGGLFFGTAPSTPGSAATDVGAWIGLVRGSDSTDPLDVLLVRCGVLHSTTDGTAVSVLHSQDLGPVKLGEMVRLRVQWDRDNHRFIFQRDDDPEVLAPYTVSDSAPPGIQVKLLDALHFVPNCTATPRPVAFIEALFDDVMVNESAVPRSAQ
jgi:hypothetical protein